MEASLDVVSTEAPAPLKQKQYTDPADGLYHPTFMCEECGKSFPEDQSREAFLGMGFTNASVSVCPECFKEYKSSGGILPRAMTRIENYTSPDSKVKYTTRNTREIAQLKKSMVQMAKLLVKFKDRVATLKEQQHKRAEAAKLKKSEKKPKKTKKAVSVAVTQKWEKRIAMKDKKILTVRQKAEIEKQKHAERAKRWREKQKLLNGGNKTKLSEVKQAARAKIEAVKIKTAASVKAKHDKEAAKNLAIKTSIKSKAIIARQKKLTTELVKQTKDLVKKIKSMQLKLSKLAPKAATAVSTLKALKAMEPAAVVKSKGKVVQVVGKQTKAAAKKATKRAASRPKITAEKSAPSKKVTAKKAAPSKSK